MATTIEKLTEERLELNKQAKQMQELTVKEERDFTPDELERFGKLCDDSEDHTEEIDKLKAAETRSSRLEAMFAEQEKVDERRSTPNQLEKAIKKQAETADDGGSESRAWESYMRFGVQDMPAAELRSLSQSKNPEGGYTSPDEQFVNRLIKFTDDLLFIRRLGTVFSVPNADSLGFPSLENDPADPTWTAELTTGNEDSTMDFGKRALTPHPIAQTIKVSKKLLRTSAINIDQLVTQRLAYKAAVVEEKGFLTGDGASEPLGLFTASDDGIPTGRDVSTGNTTSAITADGLIEAQGSLKPQYLTSAQWLFNRTTITKIRKLKTGDGQFLWQPGLQAGVPGLILDQRYNVSEFVPNTFTTGLYVGMIADFSWYWIADALNIQIERLVELAALTNQVQFISRLETDGMPVLSEAFARVTLA